MYGPYSFSSPDSSWSVHSATATAINNRGHVVGGTSAPDYPSVAYLWRKGRGMQLLGTLGGESSIAWDVNDRDEVVGDSDLPDGRRHAFLWSRGTMIDLGSLDGGYSQAYAINAFGEVVGVYAKRSGETRAFRWTRAGGMVDAGPLYAVGENPGITSLTTDINAFGQISGGVQPPGHEIRAAVRHPLTGFWQELLPGSPYVSFALGINDLGMVVGHIAPSVGEESEAVVWTPVLSFP